MTFSLSHSLAAQGIETSATIHPNLTSEELTAAALENGEGRKAKHGPLVVETGKHTGRSAKDKFIVRDGETEDTVWWDNNASMSPDHFAALKEDFLKAIAEKAIERKTGARGLRSIMEGILLDTMYDLPSLEGVEEVVISEDVVKGKDVRPLYIYSERNKDEAPATA